MPSFPKAHIVRSESYRRFVAAQPCFGCGREGASQCAHANAGKGLGMKVSDLESFPLCGPRGMQMGCHQQLDLSIELTRDERRVLERRYVERMQALAKAAGRPEFKECTA
jgi:hypothetical protein